MRTTSKRITFYTFFAFFVCFFNISSAQMPVFAPLYYKVPKILIQMHGLNNQTHEEYESNQQYTFQVTMKDSTINDITSKIFTDNDMHMSYLVFGDKKIYPSQTIFITRTFVDDNNKSVMVYGTATDSCWMFKALKGRLNAYSYLSDREQDNFDPSTIIGLQFGIDNPIEKCTKENLQKIIISDPKAMKFFDKGDYFAAIKKFNNDKSAKK